MYTADESMKRTMLQYYHSVKQSYLQWADNGSPDGHSLVLSQMASLLRASNLTDVEHDAMCVNAFLEAQLHPSVEWEVDELVFVEFFEALARISLKVIDTTEMNDSQKVRMAFNMVTELQINHK